MPACPALPAPTYPSRHVSVLQLLENAGAEATKPNNRGQTAVHAAAMNGHHDVLQHLIETKFAMDESDDAGTCPIHFCARGGHMRALLVLLKAKISVET